MEKDPSKKTKRQLKNPETFREKALKAATEQDSPKPIRKAAGLPVRGIKKLFSPVNKLFARLSKVKRLKPVFKVFRFIGRILLPKYLRTSFTELRQVSWPSFKQSRRLTYAVLIFAIVFGAAVAVADWGLGKLFKHILLK